MRLNNAIFHIAVITMTLFASCQKEQKIEIAVIPKGTTQVYWKSVHAGAEKAAQELSVNVIWQGPQKEDDREMQINVMQNFISRGVDAIVLAPLDEVALVRPVKSALKRNIKVIIIDSDLSESIYSTFVATDNYAGGKLAAKYMAKLLNGKGNVLVLRFSEGSASTTKREMGFLEGIAEYAPEIHIVSKDQFGGVIAESAMQVGQNLLNRFPDLDGIFCPNESTTFGFLRALQIAGKAGQVKLIGFDASDPLIEGLKAKEIHGLVVQNPFQIGYLGVKSACAVLNGEKVEPRIDTGVHLLTLENLDDPDMKEIVFPDIKKWLNE